MKLDFHLIGDLQRALELAPLLDRCAAEALAEFRDDPLPSGVAAGFLRERLERPETVLLVATEPGHAAGERGVPPGLCLTGPFEDPLTREHVPMVLVLYVDPELRHRGIARALVREAGRVLAARGARVLAARAGHNDDALISMGERWGFLRHWELLLRE
jgi:GNAT superfamily N-acetyltransferase